MIKDFRNVLSHLKILGRDGLFSELDRPTGSRSIVDFQPSVRYRTAENWRLGVYLKGVFMDSAHYLGDGLYCSYDGFQYRLYATNGIAVDNEVFLEPMVLQAFFNVIQEKENVKITVEHMPDGAA